MGEIVNISAEVRDNAGKGIASHAMMLSALNQCAAFAGGEGFLS